MKRNLVSAPASNPVSLAEAKTHLRVNDPSEDALISTLIAAATELVEQKTNRAFVVRTYRMDMSGFVDGVLLYGVPVSSITSVKYYDSDDSQQTVTSTNYSFSATDGKLYFDSDYSFPSVFDRHDSVQITYVSGYTTVPDAAKAAVLLILADMFENRESQMVGLILSQNQTVAALIASLKAHSL